MLVAIPSKGRAGNVKSQAIIKSASVFVPEIEADAYKGLGARNVVSVPSSVRGITKTRNWILDYANMMGERRVVFVDDDVKEQGWARAHPFKWQKIKLTEAQWLAEWERLFDVMIDAGYRIWGTATSGECRAMYPYRPFLFRSYVTASCMGMLSDGLRFDESFPVKEDYELCLRCMKEDGGVLAARYLFWGNSHWTDAGGCRDYRTAAMEEDAIRRLIKMYPGMIRRVTRGGSEFSIQLDF